MGVRLLVVTASLAYSDGIAGGHPSEEEEEEEEEEGG